VYSAGPNKNSLQGQGPLGDAEAGTNSDTEPSADKDSMYDRRDDQDEEQVQEPEEIVDATVRRSSALKSVQPRHGLAGGLHAVTVTCGAAPRRTC
jgi:hypothetical protein